MIGEHGYVIYDRGDKTYLHEDLEWGDLDAAQRFKTHSQALERRTDVDESKLLDLVVLSVNADGTVNVPRRGDLEPMPPDLEDELRALVNLGQQLADKLEKICDEWGEGEEDDT